MRNKKIFFFKLSVIIFAQIIFSSFNKIQNELNAKPTSVQIIISNKTSEILQKLNFLNENELIFKNIKQDIKDLKVNLSGNIISENDNVDFIINDFDKFLMKIETEKILNQDLENLIFKIKELKEEFLLNEIFNKNKNKQIATHSSFKFFYGLMGAGKTKLLIDEVLKGKREDFFIVGSGLKSTYKLGKIASRYYQGEVDKEIFPNILFEDKTNFEFEFIKAIKNKNINCTKIIIDDAQFLTEMQILQLVRLCKEYKVDIQCYGLMWGVSNQRFAGSEELCKIAECLPIESRSKCVVHFGDNKKEHLATRLVRITSDGKILKNIDQKPNGIEEKLTYKNVPVCEEHAALDSLKSLVDYDNIYKIK